jgi:hypothetical protein
VAESIICLWLGAAIVLSRGPLIFAPAETLRVYERLVATDGRVRLLGVFSGALAAGVLATTGGPEGAAFWLSMLGWLWAGAAVWLLVHPSGYRRLAEGFLELGREGTDPALMRLLGLFGVAIGVWLVSVGVRLYPGAQG